MTELKPCPFCGGIPKVHACDASGAFCAGLETAVLTDGQRNIDLFDVRSVALERKPI